MNTERRDFLRLSGGAALAAALPAAAGGCTRLAEGGPAGGAGGYEPWLEIDDGALRHNVREIQRLAGGRPLLAVLKNNAYGLGIRRVGPVLDGAPEVTAFAVVKPEEALALRQAGVAKPILLMALAEVEAGAELVRRNVRLAAFTDDAPDRLARVARAARSPVPVHLYIDSGMGRMGIRHDRALPWIEALAGSPDVRIEGTFTELAESDAFDPLQLAAFDDLARVVRGRGVDTGSQHAMSSHSLFFLPEAALDLVRPGLALYGAYPSGARATGLARLIPAFRLRARVVRVERLQPGDGVSYGRNYVAERPTWIATLPVGHADGYHRQAVQGGEVLIDGRRYPVIGAVSASHTVIEVGTERSVEVGDTVTLVGPDDEAILPNTVAERAGISVYDVLMRLSPELPGT